MFQDLEALLTQGTDYIDLNLFPEHGYYNEVSLSGERVWHQMQEKCPKISHISSFHS